MPLGVRFGKLLEAFELKCECKFVCLQCLRAQEALALFLNLHRVQVILLQNYGGTYAELLFLEVQFFEQFL